ncbi:uncharacterized protein KY384_005371 [Bacidia gigantensis]|uniref:uncharacterized protein n=1 Tax=Bacidia gigantensis TaxID=2732470 RepID=UPI001D0439CF|nr:uncharacterized protein KY384_005371 [Bacidia gigantensis]KAG8529890.1 hypothetical protein KY384_005371 [Bacidia gigantensis]
MSALIDIKALAIFKRYNTLYFWSLLVTSWGIIFHSIAVMLKWFVASCPWELHYSFSGFGWCTRSHPGVWLTVFHVYERIQLVVFIVQELIISIIYIRAAVIWLSPSDPQGTRHTKHFLIWLNILCIALDFAIVAEVSANEWVYEEASQSLAYAIKLTLEFAVLNKVMEVYRNGPGGCATCHRKLGSRSLASIPSSPQYHPKARQGSESRGRNFLKASWPKSKPKSPENSEPFDEEGMILSPLAIDVVTKIDAVSTHAVKRHDEHPAAKGTAGASGVTTDIVARNSDDNVRHDSF